MVFEVPLGTQEGWSGKNNLRWVQGLSQWAMRKIRWSFSAWRSWEKEWPRAKGV